MDFGIKSDWKRHFGGESNAWTRKLKEDSTAKTSKTTKEENDGLLGHCLSTTQLVIGQWKGQRVTMLKEPRGLFAIAKADQCLMPEPRWPIEMQVLAGKIFHITSSSTQREQFYEKTEAEAQPMFSQSGTTVYEYKPSFGSCFSRSNSEVGLYQGNSSFPIKKDSIHDAKLIFESRFESGNLEKAVHLEDNYYELYLRDDLYTNRHAQWYYFRVQNTCADRKYRFAIINFCKPDSLYNHGMKPLMYSQKLAAEENIGWQRIGDDVTYYKTEDTFLDVDKSPRYTLTWTFEFPYDDDTVYFAHSYPYTYSDLMNYLNDVQMDNYRCKLCQQRVLCHTLAGNIVPVLTITSNCQIPEPIKKPVVILSARVHPGETPSSWIMKGFLDFLLADSSEAQALRESFIFKIVPMLNPDGVIVGNNRCSLTGRDLNRHYQTVLVDTFPSVWHMKRMARKLASEHDVILYCDIHAHSRLHNMFMYGCENRHNAEKRLKEQMFPFLLQLSAPNLFSFDSCNFAVQRSREGTGRVVMWQMGITNSYTLEASHGGSTLGSLDGYHFSIKDYEEIAAHFCRTLLNVPETEKNFETHIKKIGGV